MTMNLAGNSLIESYLFSLTDKQLEGLEQWQNERVVCKDSSKPCPERMMTAIIKEKGRRGMVCLKR